MKQVISVCASWKTDDGRYVCPHCDKIFSYKGISSHIHLQHTEEGLRRKKESPGRPKGIPAWNKGQTAETNEKIAQINANLSKTMQEKVRNGTYIPFRPGKEARERLSIAQSTQNRGGKSKWFDIDGKRVQVS